MKMKLFAGALVAIAGLASAQIQYSDGTSVPFIGGGQASPEHVTGTVRGALTVFGPSLGAYVGGAPVDIAAPGSGLIGTDAMFVVHPSVDIGGNLRTVDIELVSITGGPFTAGFGVVTDIGFEMGQGNAAADFLDDPDFVAVVGGAGSLFGASGLLFAGAPGLFTTDQAGGFSGVIFFRAGGADLQPFGINRYVATITYLVPAPASGLALLGLVALRRRR